jgi:TATA-box binding protein (TBP) (component of TFIID and TFIIIB)
MSTTITNSNFRASLQTNIDLKNLHQLIPNSKLHVKPCQLVVKDQAGVIIFFNNGKLRIMGCKDDFDATLLAYKYTAIVSPYETPEIFLQSMTVKVSTGRRLHLLNLQKLISPAVLELEIFPALLIQKFKPVSVNIFSSGNIILCGIKKMEDVDDIMSELAPILSQV